MAVVGPRKVPQLPTFIPLIVEYNRELRQIRLFDVNQH
jgi:hypothetical protein